MTAVEKYIRQTDLLFLELAIAIIRPLTLRRAHDLDGLELIARHLEGLADAEHKQIEGTADGASHDPT